MKTGEKKAKLSWFLVDVTGSLEKCRITHSGIISKIIPYQYHKMTDYTTDKQKWVAFLYAVINQLENIFKRLIQMGYNKNTSVTNVLNL